MKTRTALSLALLFPLAVFAQSEWTGDVSEFWDVADNWDPSGVPASSPDLIFGATTGPTTLNNDIAGAGTPPAFTVSSITFDADAPAYTLGGNAIRLNTTDGKIINASSEEQVIDFDILGLRAPSATNTSFNGDFNIDTGAGGIVVNGRIVSEAAHHHIWKIGSGVLTLTNNDNYFMRNISSAWRRFNVEEGTLRLGNSHVLQGQTDAGLVSLKTANATLDFAAGVPDNTFYIPGLDGAAGSSVILQDTNAQAVHLVLTNMISNRTVRSTISGSGSLTIDNQTLGHTISFLGASTYSGGTNVLSGDVSVNDNNALGTGDVFIGAAGKLFTTTTTGSWTIANNIYIDEGILEWNRPANQLLKTGTTGNIFSAVPGGVETQFFLRASTINSESVATANQFSFKGAASGVASNDHLRLSDVFFINETGQRDYAIELRVSNLNLGAGGAYLGFYDSVLEEWITAADTTSTNGALAGFYEMSWTDFLATHGSFNGGSMRGAHGFDADTGSVWAVLDVFGNGDLAIIAIPEPATVAAILGALALIGVALVRRRRNG